MANPYGDDPDRAGAWDLGYQAGYDEPETDHYAPVGPELVDAFQDGELAGRDERRSGLSPAGPPVAPPPEVPEEESQDARMLHEYLHVSREVGIHGALHDLFGKTGGLLGLVALVVQIPSDTQLKLIEEDWEAPVDRSGDRYLAVCPEVHMAAGAEGVTPDGYWAGALREHYVDAENDLAAHGHDATFIALCSGETGECGPVARMP